MDTLIAVLPSLLSILAALIKAAPIMATAIGAFVVTIKADLSGVALTEAQKTEIDAAFDKIDAALQAACEARLAKGDQEK